MAVTHFEIDGNILCGSKAKTIKSSAVKEDVTCKRCLKKLETPADKTLKKVSKKKINIKFIEHKRFGFCLEINNDAILKLGDDLDERVGIMIMFTNAGMMSTSARFTGPVSQMITKKELDFLKEWFYNKRNENGKVNDIYVSDCKEAFGDE
jgi:hypothetical protein